MNFEFGFLTGGQGCLTFCIVLSLAEESRQKDTFVTANRSDWVCSSLPYLPNFLSYEYGVMLEAFFVSIVVWWLRDVGDEKQEESQAESLADSTTYR